MSVTTMLATAILATTMPATAMLAATMPVPFTPTVQSEEDSEDVLPTSKYLRNYLQQEDIPQQDVPEPQHVTEFSQQDLTETQQNITEFSQQELQQISKKRYQFLKNNRFRNKNLLKKDQKSI